MRVIVGLGNPGVEYQNTRHNAGILLVNKLSQIWRRKKDIFVSETKDLLLIKTASVFMNESGKMVGQLNIDTNNFYLAHDDLDIKFGEFKIQKGVGPKVHNGVGSIEQALGTKDFWRIRIGIDNRTSPVSGEEYVLQKFSLKEREKLEGVLDAIIKAIN